MSILKGALVIVVVTIFGVGSSRCEESRFKPAKGKTIAQSLNESKQEHNLRVSAMRAELPILKKQLAEEKNVAKRGDIVDSLGSTEDAQAIDPLKDVLQNEKEDLRVRELSAESLFNLYCPGLASGKKMDVKNRQKVLNAVKTVYLKQSGEFKCALADKLYKMGEKELVKSDIKVCLKNNRWQNLNTFYYNRKIDGAMIFRLLPGEAYSTKVDEDAREIIREAAGVGYPDEIRYRAIEMLVKLGDNEVALKVSKELVENGEVYEYRAKTLHLMPKIGTTEAKAVLESALKNPELKESAEGILKWEWHK